MMIHQVAIKTYNILFSKYYLTISWNNPIKKLLYIFMIIIHFFMSCIGIRITIIEYITWSKCNITQTTDKQRFLFHHLAMLAGVGVVLVGEGVGKIPESITTPLWDIVLKYTQFVICIVLRIFNSILTIEYNGYISW